MARKYKILIASILAGSGHNSAGDLLTEVLSPYQDFEVVRFVHPSNSIDRQYNDMTKHSPLVHNFFVNHAPAITADVVTLSMIHLVDQCVEVINREDPDCVISTHYVLTMWFKIAQWVTKKSFIVINTNLDYGDQTMAMFPYNVFMRSEYAISFSPEAGQNVIEKLKQDPKYVLLAGHRPKDDFVTNNKLSKEQAKKQLSENFKDPVLSQISDHKISILIAGGGGGTIQKTKGFLKKISMYQKRDIELLDKFQFFVICGQNQKFYKNLLKIRKTKLSWQNIYPFGWLSPKEYSLVQRAADFPILYGIAPATMHELMASETLPIVIHRIRADHELGNVEFVEKMRIGFYIKKDAELINGIFNNTYIRDKAKFHNRSQAILEKEEIRLNSLPENLYKVLERKRVSMYNIYKINLRNKITSYLFTWFLLFVYYLRKVIYKILGPANFFEKK